MKETVDSQDIYCDSWNAIRQDLVRLTDGSVQSFVVVTRNDAVLAVCSTPDGRLVLVEQYRYAARRTSLEFPGGKIDPLETPEDAAARELLEETGWEATHPRIMAGPIYPAPDWASHRLTVVGLTGVVAHEPTRSAEEAGMRTILVSLPEIPGLVATGKIFCSGSLAALLLLQLSAQAAATSKSLGDSDCPIDGAV